MFFLLLNIKDMSAINPGQVKRTLKKCSTSSSPGGNQITYFHLRNLPSTYYFFATLFTKIFLDIHEGPRSWFSAEITVIPKDGDPSNPKNFHPIAMSSVIPKLFHKILHWKKLEVDLTQDRLSELQELGLNCLPLLL